MNKVPFDKEKFLNACVCGCTKDRQVILDGIEKYSVSDPKLAQYLEFYRDSLWDDYVKERTYRQMKSDLGEEQLEKDTVIALRAMADKIEQKGMHFMIACELPKLPIFTGDDFVERFESHISVTIVAGPLGG